MKQVEFYTSLLFEKRKDLKMSITTVAAYMEVTRKTYSRMEEGNISLPDLIKLCALLDFELLMVPSKYIRD